MNQSTINYGEQGASVNAGAAALTEDLRQRMRGFIEDYRFALVSQPIYEFSSRRVCGYEILSRLNHPEEGTVSPGQFLPVINELQLYVEFDFHIFYESCRWMRHLRGSDKAPDWISCNFSRKTLSKADAVSKLVKVADSFGIPHECVGIELTEYENADDEKQFFENMHELKKQGFLILVDDMGSGVTSGRDLSSFPVDIVKLDRTLLLAASTEAGAQSFKRLVQIINRMGLKSLCEGIEKLNELQFVQEAGCTYGQGFLFSPPASTDSVETMMDRQSR